MNLSKFIEASNVPSWWESRVVLSFFGNEYPALFFPILFDSCKNNGGPSIQVIDLQEMSLENITALLASSFLGNRSYYWLKDIADLDAKKRSYWTTYIQSYTGPNCILCFSDKAMPHVHPDLIVTIEVPDLCDQALATTLLNLLVAQDSQRSSLVIRTMFKSRRKIPFDALCLLTHYMKVAGPDLEQFLSDWLDFIFVPDISLFDLSKYFFARNQEAFFKVWRSVGPTYGDLFWVTYWGDIFWRAYHFTRLSSQGYYEDAKKFATRLPFTFIQGGWRHVELEELKGALNYVYMLDTDIKNGVQGTPFLELLYLKFFLRHFNAINKAPTKSF